MFLCGIWKRVLQPKDTSTIQADAPLNISEAHSKCMLYLFCLQRTSHTCSLQKFCFMSLSQRTHSLTDYIIQTKILYRRLYLFTMFFFIRFWWSIIFSFLSKSSQALKKNRRCWKMLPWISLLFRVFKQLKNGKRCT